MLDEGVFNGYSAPYHNFSLGRLLQGFNDEMNDFSSKLDDFGEYTLNKDVSEEILKERGINLGYPIPPGIDVDIYRSILRVRNFNIDSTFNRNNFLKATKMITGFYTDFNTLIELNGNADKNNDMALRLAYSVDPSYPTEILLELEKLLPNDFKINREYTTTLESENLNFAIVLLNYNSINIGVNKV